MTWKDILKERRSFFELTHRGSRQEDLARLKEEAKTPARFEDMKVVVINTPEDFDRETEGFERGPVIPYSAEQIKQGKLSQADLDRRLGQHKGKEIKYLDNTISGNRGHMYAYVR